MCRKGKSRIVRLQNMYERAVEIRGLLKIISLPDKGTKLNEVPLVEREEKQND